VADREYGLGQLLDKDTPRAARLYPVKAEETTRTERAWPQDGAWLNQGGSGMCVAFSSGHRRADGPVKVDGITYDWAKKLYLESTAIYWGAPDTTLSKGTSTLSACQVLLQRGAIDRFEWVTDVDAFNYALLERGSLLMALGWYTSMDRPQLVRNAEGKSAYYCNIDYTTVMRGGHQILVNKIDLDPVDGFDPYARAKNSWGRDWAQNGTVRFRLNGTNGLYELIEKGWVDFTLIHELPRAA
jgi:hypothetical protein